MRAYFQRLPSQPLAVRRRFVVVATAVSFLFIVLLWVGILAWGGGSPATPATAPAPVPAPPAAAGAPAPAPGALPGVDVEVLSTDLLRAFGRTGP